MTDVIRYATLWCPDFPLRLGAAIRRPTSNFLRQKTHSRKTKVGKLLWKRILL